MITTPTKQGCGSMTFWYKSEAGSCYFRPLLSSRRQKNIFFLIFRLLLFDGTFTSFFKDKKLWRSHKTVGIKGFLRYYFCLIIEGSGVPKTYRAGSRTLLPMLKFVIQFQICNFSLPNIASLLPHVASKSKFLRV